MLKLFRLEGQADRRVLTADVDAGLRLITCERSRFSQMAKQLSSWRSSTGRSPDSSHEQWVLCRWRWRGTE